MNECQFEFRALTTKDNRENFDCGLPELDSFFRRYAGQNQFRHYVGTTYILTTKNRIAGFVTVSAGEIATTSLSSITNFRFPDYPLPIMRIARLAVDKEFQGLGLGKKLMKCSLELALQMKNNYGCVGVTVDAKPESVLFYQKLGFIELKTENEIRFSTPMFLAMKTIEKSMVRS